MADQQIVNRLVDRVNDFNRRVRDLEEKIRNLNARVNTLDDTLLKKTKNLNDDLQDVNDEISQLRDRIANIEVDIKEINREKRKFVKSQEIEEIENYMDLMNPIHSSFVTQKEAKEMIQEKQGLDTEKIEKIVDRKIKKHESKNKGNAARNQ
ncbi:MAG: hypothetical protein ABEJ93_01710 [Candidatus Nanohalobium sp.]